MMDNVYRNAHCTIAADAAGDSNGGCIQEQNPLLIRPCKIFLPETGPLYCLPHESSLERIFESEPLAKRAWALQERILSPRVLHCATDQLFWECNEDFKCQIHTQDLRDSGEFCRLPRTIQWTSNFWDSNISPYILWQRVVQDYCSRSLSREEDKLIALSGVAKFFQSWMVTDIYLAGLWYNSFPLGLLWKSIDPVKATRPAKYRAPSWSWASIDGAVVLRKIEPSMDTCILCLDILSSNINLVSDDPTGQVRGGSLQVYGLMKRVSLHKSILEALSGYETLTLVPVEELLENNKNSELDSRPTSVEISFFPDSNTQTLGSEQAEIYCLLVESSRESRSPTIGGLVINSTESPDCFQRIGTFQASGPIACAALKYNLLATVRNPQDAWEWFDSSNPMAQCSIPIRPKRNAADLTYRPDTFLRRRFHDDFAGTMKESKMFQFENTYNPCRSIAHNNNPYASFAPAPWRPWESNSGSGAHDPSTLPNSTPNSADWTSQSNKSSWNPLSSSRRSKTKVVHANYLAKKTDPTSVYYLDPVYPQETFQKLKPRALTLV
jgi:hypothetical protein